MRSCSAITICWVISEASEPTRGSDPISDQRVHTIGVFLESGQALKPKCCGAKTPLESSSGFRWKPPHERWTSISGWDQTRPKQIGCLKSNSCSQFKLALDQLKRIAAEALQHQRPGQLLCQPVLNLRRTQAASHGVHLCFQSQPDSILTG